MPSSPSFSDEDLRNSILAALAADDRLCMAGLRVGVLNGIAHLAGRIDSIENRCAAEVITRGVPGVRGVVNRIEAPGAPSPGRMVNVELADE